MTAGIAAPEEERFWACVVRQDDGCWAWTGAFNRGYGTFWTGTKREGAHRTSWRLAGRALIPGLVIDHLCRNKGCVNPDHLEQVTNRENTIRGALLITHCPSGHPYSGENLITRANGQRRCRACDKRQAAAQRRKIRSRPTFRDRLRGVDAVGALRAALIELDRDPHNYSHRPCPTCDPIATLLGEAFGCARYRLTGETARPYDDDGQPVRPRPLGRPSPLFARSTPDKDQPV